MILYYSLISVFGIWCVHRALPTTASNTIYNTKTGDSDEAFAQGWTIASKFISLNIMFYTIWRSDKVT